MIELIIIYLTGYIVSYLYTRASFRSKYKKWTISDRQFGLYVSLFSWIALLAVILTNDPLKIDNNKPAKW